jgi:hypothetical protein
MKKIYLLIAALSLSCSTQNPRVATKLNQEASLVGALPWNPLEGKFITSWTDKHNATMSTLFGNGSGSGLALVTWSQQEDPRWFGANIPAAPKSVEFISIATGSNHQPSYSYQEYEGTPLKKMIAQQGPTPNDRSAYLLSQRAAIMP